jgi:ubiquinone/menaquinone biosynthesis C-methylase UbiE
VPDYHSIYYPEAAFGGYSNVDGTVVFHQRIRSLLTPQMVVLDIGCGRGGQKVEDSSPIRRELSTHRGHCAKLIGIDPDPAGAQSSMVDEFHQLTDLKHWPVENESIDLAYADFVLEHVEDVDAFFSECRRVIKPGGYLCLRTPNVLSYFGIISMMVPNRYHARVATTVQPEREERDVFPTVYRCNTRGKLRRTLRQYGFEGCVYGYEAEPSYFSFSRILYALAVFHQRHAPDVFRLTLQAFTRKMQPSG